MPEIRTCRLTIYVREDGLDAVKTALPLDFEIDPVYPDIILHTDPTDAAWILTYRGPWTLDQEDVLDTFGADVVTSYCREGQAGSGSIDED